VVGDDPGKGLADAHQFDRQTAVHLAWYNTRARGENAPGS
jgi:hypothetical protein